MSDDFRSLFDDDEPEEKKDQLPEDTPEWLRDDAPTPDEEEKPTESLGFTGELQWRQELGDPFAKLDAEQDDETPNWQTEQPASTEGEASPASGLTGQLGWLQGDEAEESPEEDDSEWVEPPQAPERPSAGDYDLPPWLMGADDAEDQGMFLDETGKLSEAWLKTGDDLPQTHQADMTYDEWMARKAEEQRPRDLEEEVPDLPLGEEPVGEVKGTGELPDWFLGMEKLDASEAPDWFRDEESPAPAPASQEDLLSEFDFQQPVAESTEAATPAAEEELLPELNLEQAVETPDWMAEMGGTDLSDEMALEQSIPDTTDWAGEPEAETPEEEALPDWMSAIVGGGDELALEEALEDSMTGDTPDWMSTPGTGDLLAGLELGQSMGGEGEQPDWFAEAEPSATSDQPEWLQQLGDMASAETIIPGAEGQVTAGDDDFFAELQAMSGTSELPDLDAPVFQDIDSLLASMDSGATLPGTGELLLNPNPDIEDVFAENALGVAEQEPSRPDIPLSPDAPDWLTELGASVGQVSAAAIVRQRKDRPLEDLPSRLQNLHERGEELAAPEVDEAEELGTLATLLPGVPQVLTPTRQRPGLPGLSQDVVLTDAQRERVNLLRTLVAAEDDVQRASAIERTYDSPFMEEVLEAEEVAAPAVERPAAVAKPRARRRFKVDRFIISLVVAAGVILPFYFGQLRLGDLPPAGFAAGSSQQTAFDSIDALRSGDLVLVAVEYGPTAAAELDSLTDALLRHIFTQGARPVLVSGNPVGLLHANNVVDAINTDSFFFGRLNRSEDFTANQDYYVVRYLAGNVVGLRGFSQNAGQYLTTDIRGQATNLTINSISDFALLVVVAERVEDVRAWSEQVITLADAPVVYATGFSAAPLAEPYVQSQTGAGLLVGYRDAYTYNVLLDPSLAPPATPTAAPTEVTPEIAPTATPVPPTPVEPTEVPAVEPTASEEAIAPLEATPTIEPSPVEPSATIAPTEVAPTATQEIAATNTPAPSATTLPPTATPTELPVLTGVVDAQQTINVRQGPGTNNPVVTTLEPGTEVRVLGRNSDGSWINIQLDDGTEGWVSAELLDIQEPQSSSDKPRVMARVMAQETTPTQEGAAASLTPAAEATAEPVSAPSDAQAAAAAGTPYRNERWYSMTMGIIVIVVIIALGSIVNVLRSLFGRRAAR
jgi:SH3-like domain-containing protein